MELDTVCQESTKINLKRPKVLIVEDDLTLEPIWAHILNRACPLAHVSWATSEIEAEEMIKTSSSQKNPYDLVVTDIFLSGSKTGIDLWYRNLALIDGQMIFTSAIEPQKFRKYLGGIAPQPIYIQKPLNTDECIDTIRGILEKGIQTV